MKPLSSMRAASVAQGMRGDVTSSVTSPATSRSPTDSAALSSPSIVRFSPNVPGASGRPSSASHHA